ncbi:hypothetical protein ACIP5Y_00040 [Nocardia sp. NPDC088792]|uniref:hypothetical protein n=1 Tax=Nocardia sp. NPDC088792 TaxID=3364332 RepID=UPI003815EE79
MRTQCTNAAGGRTITIGAFEKYLAIGRERQRDPAWKATYRATRPKGRTQDRASDAPPPRRTPRPRPRTSQDRRRLRTPRRLDQPRPPRRPRDLPHHRRLDHRHRLTPIHQTQATMRQPEYQRTQSVPVDYLHPPPIQDSRCTHAKQTSSRLEPARSTPVT